MISVEFDDQIFASQVRGGISSYYANLIREFDLAPELGIRADVPRFSVTHQLAEWGYSRPFRIGRLNRRRILGILNRPARLFTPAPDVIHSTYYFQRNLSHKRPTVTTVHDMAPEILPEYFPKVNPHRNKLRHVYQADVVLCNSETTRDDLLRFAPGLKAPVLVTHLGVGAPFLGALPHPSPSVRRPYVLFVGSRLAYKGFVVLIAAMAQLRESLDLDLVIAGGGSLRPQEIEMLSKAGLAGAWGQLFPDDEGLRDLYHQAAVFVVPSYYEGFGLPVLEAMACACPVIISDAPALIEVAGGAAAIFERGDSGALAETIKSVVSGGSGTSGLAQVGQARAAAFSWRETAAKTAHAYRVALGEVLG